MNRSAAHTELVNEALLALSRAGVLCWSNKTGALPDRHGRLVSFGLKGSADIIGIVPPNGRVIAAEAKTGEGKASPQQNRFGQAVAERGGVWVVFRDIGTLMMAVDHIRQSAADAIIIPVARGKVA